MSFIASRELNQWLAGVMSNPASHPRIHSRLAARQPVIALPGPDDRRMRLSTIKLSGFKSFVDPTTLHLPTNMTGVVGPNGCGKSNIIDAIRWVMGESAASRLRGDSLTDVIFSGSLGAQAGVAGDGRTGVRQLRRHTITGEYARVQRDLGQAHRQPRRPVSNYYLNGTRCRRRDITDLFLGTGLGARSYSIIEQGMICQIIEARPEDLRVYLEEAAGISKYKERRKETETRIKPHAREPRPPDRPARGSRQAARAPASARRARPSSTRRCRPSAEVKDARVEGAGVPRARCAAAGAAREAVARGDPSCSS